FDFGMSWNLGSTSTWAIDKDSVNEVGCIHTCQGLEFDYVGVIIGDDMRYENGHIITDFTKRAKTDKSLFGIKKLYKEQPEEALKRADHIIKNTYRTLLTRGQKGCFIYCTDSALANYFKARLNYK
ncbi:MAG TPA: ATP-binding protein, partial [Erysipelotrichaceae bacterium]|nr:ATP-binding protein [Erysipelotrichaceae bacterium]